MKIYHYKKDGEYSHESNAKLDPMETVAQGKDIFLTPANATKLKPPANKANKARVFSGSWSSIDDYRGEEYYLAGDSQMYTITKKGEKVPTDALAKMDAAMAAAIKVAEITENENAYYKKCYQYQLDNIDANLLAEMNKSEMLVETGAATTSNLSLANENGIWLESLWSFYYAEKAKLLADSSYSYNFSSVGKVPNNHADIRAERKSFLGLV